MMPEIQESPGETKTEEVAASRKVKGAKRSLIMVVEDEEDLLALMVDTLSPYYAVKPYSNGKNAFDHFNDHQWELIISDLRMPVMDGMELYHTVVNNTRG
jgi:CheY-like chemotaxis protein